MATAVAWAFGTGLLIFLVLKFTIRIRVTPEEETGLKEKSGMLLGMVQGFTVEGEVGRPLMPMPVSIA